MKFTRKIALTFAALAAAALPVLGFATPAHADTGWGEIIAPIQR